MVGVMGDAKSYRVVNKLNVPIQVKGRPNNVVEVPGGKELNIRVASHSPVEFIIQGVKYTHNLEEPKQKWQISPSIHLYREAKLQKDTTLLIFKTNVQFLNESSNPIHLTMFKKELGFEEA